jgi:hypothetical protein
MTSELIATLTIIMILLLFLSMRWCLRQYYRARRKGYYPASAATVVFGGAFITVIAEIALLDSFWYGTATMVALLLFPVPALVVTVLVALLPRRPRRAGERRSSVLSSPACRALEVGLLAVARVAIVPFIVITVADSGYVIGIWPKSQLVENLSGVMWLIWIFVIGAAKLGFARERLGAPGLADTVAADTRPAVLYLRAFQQESDPFAWVTPQEYSRYTRRRSLSASMVTFEQYLSAEFARQLAPFVALGNPLDSVPPEGAARSYAPDEDWQRHFCALASTAAAIVMDGSRSDNLRWELAEITRNGWQRKLFLLTSPAPQPRDHAVRRLWEAARRLAKGVRIPRWEQFAAELTEAGLHVPPIEPDPGSVVAFDAAGRAEVLIRGAQQPEEFVTAVQTRL